MWMLRTVLHSTIVLGAVVAAGQVIGVLLATPASACFGYRCFQFHAAPQFRPAPVFRPSFGRPTTTPLTSSLAGPRSAPVNLRPHGVPSSSATLSGSHAKSDPNRRHERMRNPGANAANPSGQGGADAAAFSPNGQSRGFGPSGISPSSGDAGAGLFNVGSGNAGSDNAGSGNGSSGPGAGQLDAANGPGSSANARSANRAATNGAARGSTGATRAFRNSDMTLTAVTACVTQAGSCPMERDLGTVCQCQDAQGRVYDGIVR